jgi:Flp pilus assembly protein TadB
VLAGAAVMAFVSGPPGLLAGAIAAATAWVWIGRTEPADVRRRREAAERDVPGLVQLLAAALETGAGVAEALSLVCDACPGPAADGLAAVPPRLALGLPPDQAWAPVLADPQLAPLGRALVRASRSGSSVTHEVARLADELSEKSRATVEERARSVGVKAAIPLGLCLLPSFVLLGVVPLVVALLQSLDL